MITAAQCRAARALLSLKQSELATAADVHLNTVDNFEGGKRRTMAASVEAIERALVGAGVEFIPENGGGAGVRLKK